MTAVKTKMMELERGIVCSLDVKSAFDKLDRTNAINTFINKVGGYKFLFKNKSL